MQSIEMAEFNNNKKQIHCKLTYNDQIRRFLFNGTEFADLLGQVSNLLSLPFGGFVLKYVDNESDLITITSNEDLHLALEISDKILRLVVDSPTTSAAVFPPSSPSSTATPTFPVGGHCGGRGRGRGYGHHHHYGGGGGGGYHPHSHERGNYFSEDKKEKAKTRIQEKINFLKSTLEHLPEDHWKRKAMQMKIHNLEGRLLRWDALCDKKMLKKKLKEEKKDKKEKKTECKKLSPEALTQVQSLKAQVVSLKPVIYQLKVTKKAKKSELELALQNGQGDKEIIWNEILRLKESIHETQKQISALKDQIRAIAKADCTAAQSQV